MNIVEYDEKKHYHHFLLWWDERGLDFTPASFLPKSGIVIEDDNGIPFVAGFLYLTNGGVAMINTLISDKSRKDRSLAIDVLIDTLITMAKSSGYKVISCATNLEHLTDRYIRHGFQKFETGVTHMGKILTEERVS